MKKKLILVLIIIVLPCALFTACNNAQNKETIKIEKNIGKDVKYVDAKNLSLGMSRDDIEKQYGKPIDSIGSGLSILLYMENKTTMLTLYFDMQDKLSKVESTDNKNDKKVILE